MSGSTTLCGSYVFLRVSEDLCQDMRWYWLEAGVAAARGGVMTRVETLRRRRNWLSLGVIMLVLCVCAAGLWGASRQPGARTVIGNVLGGSPIAGPTHWVSLFLVGRRSGDGAVQVSITDGSLFSGDVEVIGKAHLFRPHGGSGFWVGSQKRTHMWIKVADDSGTLSPGELLQVRRLVCDLYRPAATAAELPWLATLATVDVNNETIDPIGVVLEVLITLMVAAAVGLGVWRFRVGRELTLWKQLELDGGRWCPKCGYEAAGARICPECGLVIPVAAAGSGDGVRG